MPRLTLSFLMSLALLFSESRGHGSGNFPLNGCHTGQFDVLVIFSDMGSFSYDGYVIYSAISNLFVDRDTEMTGAIVDTVYDYSMIYGVSCDVRLHPEASHQEEINLCKRFQNMSSVNLNTNNILTKIRTYIKLVSVVFTDMGLGRSNSTQTTIIIFNGEYNSTRIDDEFRKIPDLLQEERSEAKVFVLVYDMGSNDEPLYLRDSLFIPGLSLESRNNIVSIVLCNQCMPGWFMLESKGKSNFVSCYKIDVDDNNIHWYEASRKCTGIGANLATVESKEELHLLEEQLFEHLLANIQHINGPGESLPNLSRVYIGLKRDSKTVAQRFQWELYNPTRHRPLVLNHWLVGEPDGGFSHACGVWLFQTKVPIDAVFRNVSADRLTFSGYRSNNIQGWSDVRCGKRETKLSVCEVTVTFILRDEDDIIINPANEESFNKVSRQNEFQEYKGTIVSVSAYVNKEEFKTFLKDNNGEFPLFDCGDCADQPRYISYSYVCDRVDHCSNGHDENVCILKKCETLCRSGQCIPHYAKCDIFKDCDDGSDEDHCQSCIGRRSCDGACLPAHMFNDDQPDCSLNQTYDNTIHDLLRFPQTSFDGNETCSFICNIDQCIHLSQIGDGKHHCCGPEGPLDETLGKLPTVNSCSNSLGNFLWSPECVYIRDRYGLVLGCGDVSHLQDCENFTCQEGYVKCPGSYCIPLNYVLDGKNDCPMGEEERETGNHTCIGNFACWNSKVCLHPDLVCDGHVDCPYKEDELNCNVSCPEGIRCIAGTIAPENKGPTTYTESIRPAFKTNAAHMSSAVYVKETGLEIISTSVESYYIIDYKVRYIDLSGVDLSNTSVELHDSLNLFDIKLSRCRLLIVFDRVFYSEKKFPIHYKHLSTIFKMDLSYNLIRSFNIHTSIGNLYMNLRTLNLSFNEYLDTFVINVFIPLETLDLAHTGLLHLDEISFKGLRHLKHLNLSYTTISTIHKHTFSSSFTLETLDLRGAPITQFSENLFNGLIIRSSLYADNFGLCCPQVRGQGIPGHTCHAIDDAISSCIDLIGGEVQRVLLWLVGVVATLGNLIVIVYRLIWDRSILNLAYGLFVLNLGISDLIMGLYLLMIAGADVYYRGMYVLYHKIWKKSVVCKTAGFLATLSSETSTFFIFLITVDRFLVLKFPFGQKKFSRMTKMVAVVLAWGVGFMLALISVLPIFGDESIFSSSAMCIGLFLTNERVNGWEYSFSVFIVLNFIMFLIIAFGQAAIFRSMSENRVSKEATNQNSLRRAQNITVAKQLSLVVLSDFLCWFPIGFMGLLSLSGHEFSKDVYAWTVVLVLPVNSALNPLLYTIPVVMARWEKFKYGHSTHR